jgi:uncharacterized iron-regulated membrane protein
MDFGEFGNVLVAGVALVLVALVLFGFAVWFGQHVIAPRLGRSLDRAEAEDDQLRDRDD